MARVRTRKSGFWKLNELGNNNLNAISQLFAFISAEDGKIEIFSCQYLEDLSLLGNPIHIWVADPTLSQRCIYVLAFGTSYSLLQKNQYYA